ncbi:TPA: hypothetical protein NNA44_004370 [Escherichia coli]|nr:hypothetical protein [Escherichia coli]HAV9253324.1 hypothetical protein [Escherichia coli]HAW0316549.1 hypothetical protein [Escherichia coli]HAW1122940.1 hypothetical protein [Escherichia coli]HCH7642694.1 hypothetical protein [Escherichia coli]
MEAACQPAENPVVPAAQRGPRCRAATAQYPDGQCVMKLQIWPVERGERVVPVSRSALRDCVPADAAGIDAATDVDVLLPFSRKKPLPGVLSAVMLRTEPASLSPPGPAVNRRAAGFHPDARAGLQTPPAESPPLLRAVACAHCTPANTAGL